MNYLRIQSFSVKNIFSLFFILLFLVACGGGGAEDKKNESSLKSEVILINSVSKSTITKSPEINNNVVQLTISDEKELGTTLKVGKTFVILPGEDERFPLGLSGIIKSVERGAKQSTVINLSPAKMSDVMDEINITLPDIALNSSNLIGVLSPTAVRANKQVSTKILQKMVSPSKVFLDGGIIFNDAKRNMGSERSKYQEKVISKDKISLSLEAPISLGQLTGGSGSAGSSAKIMLTGFLKNLKVKSPDYNQKDISLNSMQLVIQGDLEAKVEISGKAKATIGNTNQAWREVNKKVYELIGQSIEYSGLQSNDKKGKYPLAALVFSLPCAKGCVYKYGKTQTPIRMAEAGGVIVWIYLNAKGEISLEGSVGIDVNAGFEIGAEVKDNKLENRSKILNPKDESKRFIEAPFVEGEIKFTSRIGLSIETDFFLAGVRPMNASVAFLGSLDGYLKGSPRFSYGVSKIGDPWEVEGGDYCWGYAGGGGAIVSLNFAFGAKVDTSLPLVNGQLQADFRVQIPTEEEIQTLGWIKYAGLPMWYTAASEEDCVLAEKLKLQAKINRPFFPLISLTTEPNKLFSQQELKQFVVNKSQNGEEWIEKTRSIGDFLHEENYKQYKISGLIEATNQELNLTKEYDTQTTNFEVLEVNLHIQDAITKTPLGTPKTDITIQKKLLGLIPFGEESKGFPEDDGIAKLFFIKGEEYPVAFYKLTVTREGYEDYELTFEPDGQAVTVDLIPNSAGNISSLSGKVTDSSGNPIQGAYLEIVANSDKSTLLSYTLTNTKGIYTLKDIKRLDERLKPIKSFTLTIKRAGYFNVVKNNVAVLENGKSIENITMYPKINHPPTAQNIQLTANKNTSLSITLKGTDPDGDNLNYTIITQPQHGVLSGTGSNIGYTPTLDYVGQDQFTYAVDDGLLQSGNVGVVSITLKDVIVTPVVAITSITPATTNTYASLTQNFVITGANLTSNISMTLADCPSPVLQAGGTTTRRVFSCTPQSVGTKAGNITDGNVSKSFSVLVKATPDSVSIGSILSPIDGATENTQSIQIMLNATDTDGIKKVSLFFKQGGSSYTVCEDGTANACVGNSLNTTVTVNPADYGATAGQIPIVMWVKDEQNNATQVYDLHITWNPSAVANITSVTPDTAHVYASVAQNFVITGANLTSNISMTLADCPSPVLQAGGTATQRIIQCVPAATGTKSGTIIDGTSNINFTVNVEPKPVFASTGAISAPTAGSTHNTQTIQITLNAEDQDGLKKVSLIFKTNVAGYVVCENGTANPCNGNSITKTITVDPSSYGATAGALEIGLWVHDDNAQDYQVTRVDSVAITWNPPATINAPQNVQATAGDSQVTLTWDNVAGAVSYDVCQATESITVPVNCATHQGGQLHLNQSSPVVLSTLTNDIDYFFVVIAKDTNGVEVASAVASATPHDSIQATGRLNDTGITTCGDYAYGGGSGNHNNNLNCNGTDPDGDPIPPGQDALYGRDTTHNDDSDGHAGFSFTKISNTGQALPASASSWSCVKDNVTGLIWEVKSTSGLHNKSDRYNWYNTDNSTNGGSEGYADDDGNICTGYDVNDSATYCNTQAYVTRVNTATHCGANDWRMPTREELRSIADRGTVNPAIHTAYFPNTVSTRYWSSSPYALISDYAWVIHFLYGNDYANFKSHYDRVRLVRSGQ